MVLEKILGVPRVNGTDQRGVDVYFGNLTCRNFRFGGEGGGFTPVVNFVKKFSPNRLRLVGGLRSFWKGVRFTPGETPSGGGRFL
ncbi:MAG: hypothetical protein Ct9H300mP1_33630 [Planctomycetaceae bacterium]|nr:MAG: hypothetical protein Ct9H300mP1_33630 [Planctomycetaceae bacterium]